MTQEKNKKDGYASWIRFRNRVIAGLGIFALITLYASFYFVGSISGKVVDAKTGEPIANIEIEYIIDGSEFCFYLAHSCPGWSKRVKVYTDDKGDFNIPISIEKKIPFIKWVDGKRRISANGTYSAENKNYDNYKEEFAWFPFSSFKFTLVPVPKTLDDCRDNLTEEEQYRCVKMLARRDAREINKLSANPIYDKYLDSKYLHLLKNYCEGKLSLPYSNRDVECDAVLATIAKNKDICLNDDMCLFFSAVDLKDKTWCKKIPEKENNYSISRENCEYIIDTLTAEKK